MLKSIWPVAAWVLAFVLFLLVTAVRGMPRTERLSKLPRSPYLPRVVMEFGYFMLDAPANACVKLGIAPNTITSLSLILALAGAVALARGSFVVGGWLSIFSFMCDAWDGIVARKTGTSSIAGEFYDATVDRYNDLVTGFGLLFYYRGDLVPWLCTAAMLVGATLTSYTRAKGESVGVDPNLGSMARHERAVYLGLACVSAPFVAYFTERGVAHPRYFIVVAVVALIAVVANVTAVRRARFVLAALANRGATS